MDSDFRDELDEVRGMVLAQQVQIAELQHQNEQLQTLHRSDTKPSASRTQDGPRRLSRAGMLKAATAGAAATLGAGALMQAKAPHAAAANGQPVTAGGTVTAESATSIMYDGTTNPGAVLFVEDATTYSASSLSGAAITGFATGTNVAFGVLGYSNASGGVGVLGSADSGPGVYGEAFSSGNAGVHGQVESTGGYGVLGTTQDFAGAYAGVFDGDVSVTGGSTTVHNPSGHAILGTSDATHYGGLSGATTVSGGAGLIGTNSNVAGAYGGLIYGPLVVTGTKSAAVMHPDGTRRLVYCVEAPESYLEDIGRANLVNGRAEVRIRDDFTALIDSTDYYVFLTGETRDTEALVVTERHADRFVVQERKNGRSGGRFQYRIMAKRGDVTAERLARFDVPEPAIAAATHHPPIPETPARPKPQRP